MPLVKPLWICRSRRPGSKCLPDCCAPSSTLRPGLRPRPRPPPAFRHLPDRAEKPELFRSGGLCPGSAISGAATGSDIASRTPKSRHVRKQQHCDRLTRQRLAQPGASDKECTFAGQSGETRSAKPRVGTALYFARRRCPPGPRRRLMAERAARSPGARRPAPVAGCGSAVGANALAKPGLPGQFAIV